MTPAAAEDPCEAWLTEQVRFDLRPIKRRYQTAYDQDSGVVYLRLARHSASLVYRF